MSANPDHSGKRIEAPISRSAERLQASRESTRVIQDLVARSRDAVAKSRALLERMEGEYPDGKDDRTDQGRRRFTPGKRRQYRCFAELRTAVDQVQIVGKIMQLGRGT